MQGFSLLCFEESSITFIAVFFVLKALWGVHRKTYLSSFNFIFWSYVKKACGRGMSNIFLSKALTKEKLLYKIPLCHFL